MLSVCCAGSGACGPLWPVGNQAVLATSQAGTVLSGWRGASLSRVQSLIATSRRVPGSVHKLGQSSQEAPSLERGPSSSAHMGPERKSLAL